MNGGKISVIIPQAICGPCVPLVSSNFDGKWSVRALGSKRML